MKRYEISNDFKEKFIQSHPNVWKNTVKPTYFALDDDSASASDYWYSFENSKYGLVVFSYTYTVQTNNDTSMIPLFFDADGKIDDYITLDGWKLYFSRPYTADLRCGGMYVYMQKGDMSVSCMVSPNDIAKSFPSIWEKFAAVRKCDSQAELDYVNKIFSKDMEIKDLLSRNLKQEAKIDALNQQIESHKNLIKKIEEMVGI